MLGSPPWELLSSVKMKTSYLKEKDIPQSKSGLQRQQYLKALSFMNAEKQRI